VTQWPGVDCQIEVVCASKKANPSQIAWLVKCNGRFVREMPDRDRSLAWGGNNDTRIVILTPYADRTLHVNERAGYGRLVLFVTTANGSMIRMTISDKSMLDTEQVISKFDLDYLSQRQGQSNNNDDSNDD
jgi:hypothetical protein